MPSEPGERAVTRRREAPADRLALAEAVLRGLEETAVLAWEVEDDTDPGALRLVLWTPAAERATGLSGAECLGQTMREAFPPLLETPLPAAYLQVALTGVARDLGEINYGDDRVRRAVFSVRAFPLPERRVAVAFQNVTRRKTAERGHAQAEERYRAILESAGDAIITIDETGRIRSANPATGRLFGHPTTSLIGQSVALLIPEASRDHHGDGLHRFRQSDGSDPVGGGREAIGRRRDGSTFPIELTVSELRVDGLRLFTGVVRDISDRKAIERLKSEFISAVSHELRTPLTSIRGSLGLIDGGVAGVIPEKARALASIALRNTDRLIRLVNDILDLEKLEGGHMQLRHRPIAPAQLGELTVAGLAGLAHEHDVRIAFRVGDGAAHRIHGDPDRLVQLLTNLLSNAITHTPPGTEAALAVEADADVVRFVVTDAGPGVPPAHRELIFDRFRQRDGTDARARAGSGLGLAIARAIAEEHGGTITVDDADGGGARFTVTLPAAPATP